MEIFCALAQTEAQGALQAAEVRQKGLKKQLAEEKRKLASMEKEAGGLAQQLQREQRQVDDCSARLAPAWQLFTASYEDPLSDTSHPAHHANTLPIQPEWQHRLQTG